MLQALFALLLVNSVRAFQLTTLSALHRSSPFAETRSIVLMFLSSELDELLEEDEEPPIDSDCPLVPFELDDPLLLVLLDFESSELFVQMEEDLW